MSGVAWKFGDGISTDHIAPGRYFHLRSEPLELAKHVLEDARRDFPTGVKKGDYIVDGTNFGQGSSREHAPLIIKLSGVEAVIAKSFARIFYRNAINIGLVVVIANTDEIKDKDLLEVNLTKGIIKNITEKKDILFKPIPKTMLKILKDGGIIEHIKKHDGFAIE